MYVNMLNKRIYDALIEVLRNKIPKKTQLADFIADVLSIEKETAYRRLRGASMFTFNEVVILSHKLNFSVDEIILNSTKAIPATNMMMKSYYEDNKVDADTLEKESFLFMRQFVEQPHSEFGAALRSIPYPLLFNYSEISRYYKFKYVQHANNPDGANLFSEIKLDKYALEEAEDNFLLFQNISHTIYIWDKKIIPIIVDDIKYFRSLGLMNDNDVKVLKSDLIRFVDDLEAIATKGIFENTGNKIDVYISDEDIDSTYTYCWSEQICLSTLITHISYMIMSYNNKSKCKEVRDWVTSMKLNSALISGTGGRERVLFFNQQRKSIANL